MQDTAYTGLALIDGGEGEIEIGAGHFLSKGLNGEIKNGIIHEPVDNLLPMNGIQIGDGMISSENNDVHPPSISDLQRILEILKIIQGSYPNHCIEFGIWHAISIDHYPAEIIEGASAK